MRPTRAEGLPRDAFAELVADCDPALALARALEWALATTGSELGFVVALRPSASRVSDDELAVSSILAARAGGGPCDLPVSAVEPWIAATRERGAPWTANEISAARGDDSLAGRSFASFCGIPLVVGSTWVGVLGLADRPGGYEAGALPALAPIASAIALFLRARQLQDAQDELTHDLNNLLAGVLGYAGLARGRVGTRDPLLAEWLREIEEAGLRGRDRISRGLATAAETKPTED